MVGDMTLRNRIALAPLTRGRSDENHVPTTIMREYYRQRSSCGLVISEATGISRQGMGWWCGPGIWNSSQVAEWKHITDTVHKAGGVFAMQFWHMGRQAHSDVTGQPTVAPSPIGLGGEVTAVRGEKKPYEVPQELSTDMIAQIVSDYRTAAVNAKAAGVDMIELHGANGYLLDLFLQSVSNKRTDAYGGSVEKRLRMLNEVLDAVLSVYPKERVGVRLSPNGAFGEMGSADNVEQFTAAIRMLGERQVAYIHLMDGLSFGFHKLHAPFTLRQARDILQGTAGATSTALMGNAGYTRDTAEERLQAGDGDMIAFGRDYLSTPDLPERFAANIALNKEAPRSDWFGKGATERGYTDFPTAAKL